jgi:outer membrane protein assembly factor BamB/orotate phosphoribosyltransferase
MSEPAPTLWHLVSGCIHKSRPGKQLYGIGGRKLAWMFDLRPLLLDADALDKVATEFWERYEGEWPFQLAAVETAGIPIMIAVMMQGLTRGVVVNGVIIRKKRKKHGFQEQIEGRLDPALPVVVVDDSANSCGTLEQARVVLREAGARISEAFVVVGFDSQRGKEWEHRHQIPVRAVFKASEFGVTINNPFTPKTECRVAWTFASPNPNFAFAVAKSTPVVADGRVVFGSDAGVLWCLDALTGRVLWWYGTADKTGKGIVSSPKVQDGRVYFGSYAGTLHCLDIQTGREVWSSKPCDYIGSSPCLMDGKLFIGLEYQPKGNTDEALGACGAFDMETGECLWLYPTKNQLHGSPTPVPSLQAVIWGTNDSDVLLLNAGTGDLIRKCITGGPIKYPVSVREQTNQAVFGSFDGGIYVWDYVTGEVQMQVTTEDIVYSTALIDEGRAWMGSADNTLTVVDLDRGVVLRQIDVGEKVHASPARIGNVVYVGTSGGLLLGFDRVSMDLVARYQFPERITNAVVASGNLLYVLAFDNRLWAVEV